MSKSYTLASDEKATQVMIGTSDVLLWGDLVTKEQAVISAFLNTLAEDFVPMRDVKVLFLAPTQQHSPAERRSVHVKLEEILLFFAVANPEPLPQETEVRRLEPIEAIVGSFQIEGAILKSPIASLDTMLLVSKDAYMPIYKAQIRHVAKPWLGAFAANIVMVRRDRLTIATH
jgi:hypothetical protein